ncbi:MULTISPECIES: hypothetical protein [Enterobacter]|uniref:hypothetical protein n=1 Tax=Enterobacter TaxID=547 RepID=UPI0007ADD027|nr:MULTISPECIES: hypothetical protein [Enterobacter]AMZ77795.1 hypothetical protein A4308_12620 [Enterobacter sp. ODB01]EKS6337398.1 hypothetical protein [Enterobacter hormaechei]
MERVLSLELNIPPIWQEIMLPEEARDLIRRHEGRTDALPSAIANRLTRLGFISASGRANINGGPRRYILRAHTFPISRNFYRHFILPNLKHSFIPDNQRFSRAMTSAPVINAQRREEEMNRYLNNEAFRSPQEATDFLNNLFTDF